MSAKSRYILVYEASVAILFLGACSGETGNSQTDDAGISVGGLSSTGGSTSNASIAGASSSYCKKRM